VSARIHNQKHAAMKTLTALEDHHLCQESLLLLACAGAPGTRHSNHTSQGKMYCVLFMTARGTRLPDFQTRHHKKSYKRRRGALQKALPFPLPFNRTLGRGRFWGAWRGAKTKLANQQPAPFAGRSLAEGANNISKVTGMLRFGPRAWPEDQEGRPCLN
jgi:hypothetical protein